MPDQVRAMIPRDLFLVFEGWQAAHSPPEPGSDAPDADEVRALMERYG